MATSIVNSGAVKIARKIPLARQADRNDPGQQKSHHNLNRNGDNDVDQGNEQAVPETAIAQDVYKVLKADVAGDATTEDVVRQAIVNRRKNRERT